MRFTLPQFSEHEAKIIGPLTLKQTGYIGSAAVAGFILFHSLPFHIFLPITIILGLSSFALAFLKINGRSLPTVLMNGLNFFISSNVYLWKKTGVKKQIKRKTNIETFKKGSHLEPIKTTKTGHLKKLNTKITTKQ